MLYDLISIRRGKQTLVMRDSLSKVNNRMKTLKASQRRGVKGERVTYSVVTTEDVAKFKCKPHSENYRAGDKQTPKKVN